VSALDRCKILDPACGSGAFPMGVLQKMVHMLQKLDPENLIWKEVQIQKVQEETSEVFKTIDDKAEREEKLKEINNAFDQRVNDPDYARKLYLIENCIYGVDIQPIATQISKLRFFISLVVDQKSNSKADENFGIRPLPNLETKFVTANTLIGINKEANLFTTDKVKELEKQLKHIRHKLFSARTKDTKLKYRQKDEELRKTIAEELKKQGLPIDSAEKLAKWDPYDQNASSPFFDPEWMFDIADGFDVVIGNPPYHQLSKDASAKKSFKEYLKNKYKTSAGRLNLFIFFTHEAIDLAKKSNGVVSYIIPNTILTQEYYSDTRKKILNETSLIKLVNYDEMPFENAVVENVTFVLKNYRNQSNLVQVFQDNLIERRQLAIIEQNQFLLQKNFTFNINSNDLVDEILANKKHRKISSLCEVNQGIALKGDKSLSLKNSNPEKKYYRLLDGRNINKYKIEWDGVYLDYDLDRIHSCKRKDIFESEEKLFFRRVSKNLIFTYDNNQFYALNTIVVVNRKPNCKDNLKVLLGIFNSDLLNYIYQKQFKSTKKVFSEIQARSVKDLPIPVIDTITEKALYFISSILIYQNSNEKIFATVSNALVNQLYFPDHMQEREIDVLQFVERDIEKVMQGREFEKLSDTEKEQVIEQLHQTWSHPDSEVRNRIKLFAVRSPEILKPIIES
ncbi:MAG: TaqI-like C-terminal specificity domain-containing protein, partial [Bacteroidales bacterium]|nr:TaqI-like C-terminal specificity domain-containing protein [Bacteroidales bacterium]